MKFRCVFSPLAVPLLLVSPLFAQEADRKPSSGNFLEPLVVVADQVGDSAQKSNEAKQAAPNAMTVISAEQLNQFGDQPLGDALRRLPGVAFGGANRAREIQLRGIGTQYTQVLINGRAVIDGSSKRGVQVDRIPSSLVERVEISWAPLAKLDGQGAAGTVNIILKNTNFTPRTELGLGAGYLESNGWLGDATFFQAGEWGALKYSFAGGLQRQRRNESKDTFNFTGAGAPDGGKLGLNEREFNQVNLLPSFELELTPQDSLLLEPSFLWTEENRDDVSRELESNQVTLKRREVEFRNRVRENYGIFGAWRHELADGSGDFELGLDSQYATEETDRDAERFKASGALDRTRTRGESIDLERHALTFKQEQTIGKHRLAWGADFNRSTRDESNFSITNGTLNAPNNSRTYEIKEERWNAYLQDEWAVTPSTRLTGGVRLEQSTTETRDFFGATTDSDSFFILPSLNVVHALREDLDLRAGIAKTVRRPDLRELSPTVVTAGGTVANPDIGGNPNQEPEEILGLDTGLDYYFYGRKGVISLNGFARQFEDKIEFVTALEAGRFVSRPQNTGDGEMYGVELDGRVPLEIFDMPQLTLWGNVTWIHTELDDPLGGSRPFLKQPDALANLGVDWFVEPLNTTFGLSVNWNSGWDQTERLANGGTRQSSQEDLARLDFSARTQLSDQLSLSLSMLNLLGSNEKLAVREVNAAGTTTASSGTLEDTYRSVYLKLNYTF